MMFLARRVLPLLTLATLATAWSSPSSFTGTALLPRRQTTTAAGNAKLVMYDQRGDAPQPPQPVNAWSVLAKTEEWISATLQASASADGQNPYTRKEVSYVCETASDQAMIVAGIFRRLKEARELGQRHGEQEQERALDQGPSYRPSTLRQTQVVVLPSNTDLNDSFVSFNTLIESINGARRHARDYVTDAHLDRIEEDDDGDEWSVAVNCAHLHPNFGEKTAAEELTELQEEETAGEVDVNYREFQEKRRLARRSPYPTVVLEVRASPSVDFGSAPLQATSPPAAETNTPVTADDLQKLEALFGRSAHMNHPTKHLTSKEEEEDFYSRIGANIQELSSVTPLQLAQDYIASHEAQLPAEASFTSSGAQEIDEAYEFLFTNFAMMAEQAAQYPRYYVALPQFCSASATSLEKFVTKLTELCESLTELKGHLVMETWHPEHIEATRRAPIPVLSIQWKDAA